MDSTMLVLVVLAAIVFRDCIKWIVLSRELEEIKELLREISKRAAC